MTTIYMNNECSQFKHKQMSIFDAPWQHNTQSEINAFRQGWFSAQRIDAVEVRCDAAFSAIPTATVWVDRIAWERVLCDYEWGIASQSNKEAVNQYGEYMFAYIVRMYGRLYHKDHITRRGDDHSLYFEAYLVYRKAKKQNVFYHTITKRMVDRRSTSGEPGVFESRKKHAWCARVRLANGKRKEKYFTYIQHSEDSREEQKQDAIIWKRSFASPLVQTEQSTSLSSFSTASTV